MNNYDNLDGTGNNVNQNNANFNAGQNVNNPYGYNAHQGQNMNQGVNQNPYYGQNQSNFNQNYESSSQNSNFNGGQFNNQNQGYYNSQNQNMNPQSGNDNAMGIVAYITLIGWLVALISGRNGGQGSPYLNFHLNQALVIMLFSFLSPIPYIGWLWGVFMFVCWLICFIGACSGETRPAPLIGNIHIMDR